jgi:3-phosphoshikimate 1-carboxyvinyltransferase
LKESDRIATTAQLLRGLGGQVTELPDGLIVRGTPHLTGGTVDACNDHRIAMSAAVASCLCAASVTVCGSECVAKSYPRFWEDYSSLKG